MPGRPFIHGFEIYLEKATISHDSRATPLTVYTDDGQVSQPKFAGGGDPISSFALEIQAAADGVRTGREPDLLSGKLARNALVMCLAECESVKTGKTIPIS
jgi:predicted dehydrogenase